ncbi:hypothetical protein NM688_g7944 [Phlebia brevispora]|uniref:Uncharacterized protein n=1 Tax=Phlebia brevispora TaxID=194682 RepID=A0ACC1RZD2_9APHY|nr:hypothetical protein NM688_g7944 [Phlebia brevispora]
MIVSESPTGNEEAELALAALGISLTSLLPTRHTQDASLPVPHDRNRFITRLNIVRGLLTAQSLTPCGTGLPSLGLFIVPFIPTLPHSSRPPVAALSLQHPSSSMSFGSFPPAHNVRSPAIPLAFSTVMIKALLFYVFASAVFWTGAHAFIPAMPSNGSITFTNGTQASTLKLNWFEGGFTQNVTYQLVGANSNGINKGVLMHFSEDTMTNDTSEYAYRSGALSGVAAHGVVPRILLMPCLEPSQSARPRMYAQECTPWDFGVQFLRCIALMLSGMHVRVPSYAFSLKSIDLADILDTDIFSRSDNTMDRTRGLRCERHQVLPTGRYLYPCTGARRCSRRKYCITLLSSSVLITGGVQSIPACSDAQLLYSKYSQTCTINAEYADPVYFDQIMDIFASPTLTVSNTIDYEYSALNTTVSMVFNATFLNDTAQLVNNTVVNGTVTSEAYLFASLIAYNATGDPGAEPNGTASSTSSDGGDGQPQQKSSLAMIILYAITGCVSALFCVVIVSGAIRAIRHPERYGPRVGTSYGPGTPGYVTAQSRARGLTRAILDTFPIVKFGRVEDGVQPDRIVTHKDVESAGATDEAEPAKSGGQKE